jgi:hypothetical protein
MKEIRMIHTSDWHLGNTMNERSRDEENAAFSVSPEIWSVIDRKHKAALTRICNQKLKDYFKD